MSSIVSSIVRGIVRSVASESGGGVDLSALKAAAISLWTLNEASGSFLDLKATNHLVETGTLTRGAGKVGNAPRSSSAANFAQVTAAALSPADTSFWVSAWIKLDNTTAHQGVFGTTTGGAANGWGVRTSFAANGDIQFLVAKASVFSNYTVGNGAGGGWNLCIFGYENAAQKVWTSFNGSAITEAAHTTGCGAGGALNLFGLDFLGVSDCSIDELGVYSGDRPDASSISALYNGGVGISNAAIAA